MDNPSSPFNWRQTPSVLSKSHDFNGTNTRRGAHVSPPLGAALHNPKERSINAFGRAVLAKTRAAYEVPHG